MAYQMASGHGIGMPSAAAVAAADNLGIRTPGGHMDVDEGHHGHPAADNEMAMDSGMDTIPEPEYASHLPPPTWRVKPQFASWEIDHKRFEIIKLLGKGSYGSVAEAIDHVTGKRVAVKKINQIFEVFENAKRIYREVRILRSLDHPNVIKIIHIQQPPEMLNFQDLYVVFECMDTDFAKLTKDDSQCLTVPHVRWFLYQLLLGMKYIHSARILHRDIKPANVLLTEACDLKICDFGLARSMDVEDLESDEEDDHERDMLGIANPKEADTMAHAAAAAAAASTGSASSSSSSALAPPDPFVKRQMTRHVVTRWYRAPELPLYNDGDYSPAIDVWSIGCVYAEMLGMLDTGDPEQRYDRKALFPGGSCYPMSKDRSQGKSRDGKEKKDQLQVIMEVLGTPHDDELRRMRTEAARQYILALKRRPEEDLNKRYPTAGADATDLLRRFLRFLPEDRISIDDALAHPFLTPIRRPREEAASVRKDGPVRIRRATPENIRELIVEEVRGYNHHIPANWQEICARQAYAAWAAQVQQAGSDGSGGSAAAGGNPGSSYGM